MYNENKEDDDGSYFISMLGNSLYDHVGIFDGSIHDCAR